MVEEGPAAACHLRRRSAPVPGLGRGPPPHLPQPRAPQRDFEKQVEDPTRAKPPRHQARPLRLGSPRRSSRSSPALLGVGLLPLLLLLFLLLSPGVTAEPRAFGPSTCPLRRHTRLSRGRRARGVRDRARSPAPPSHRAAPRLLSPGGVSGSASPSRSARPGPARRLWYLKDDRTHVTSERNDEMEVVRFHSPARDDRGARRRSRRGPTPARTLARAPPRHGVRPGTRGPHAAGGDSRIHVPLPRARDPPSHGPLSEWRVRPGRVGGLSGVHARPGWSAPALGLLLRLPRPERNGDGRLQTRAGDQGLLDLQTRRPRPRSLVTRPPRAWNLAPSRLSHLPRPASSLSPERQ